MFIEFVIQNQFFSYSLEEFAQILDIPCEGVCVFTNKWSLDELAYGVHTDGPYQTNPPSPNDIISSIRIDRQGQLRRIRHEEEIDVLEYQILTCVLPSNPQPLQSHPSLDITLSLSPITPLDHIHDTSSPPSPPQPQPPIMGHPLYYNYHDYHGSTYRTLFLTLRDEMNIMFAHLEYLLTIELTSHFPPPP
nr:pentatricopeptide repeat-containing protein [Tanacetum cinerariifolium]